MARTAPGYTFGQSSGQVEIRTYRESIQMKIKVVLVMSGDDPIKQT